MSNTNATCGEALVRTPKHEELIQAAITVKGVLEHARELAGRLGVDIPDNPERKQTEDKLNNLVSVLLFLPEEVGKLASEAHAVLNSIEDNLT